MTGLTHLQGACLSLIEGMQSEGVSPSYEELRVGLNLSSKGEVSRLLHALKERGFINWLPARARSIRVLPTAIGPAELQHLTSAELRTTIAHAAGILAHREGGGTPQKSSTGSLSASVTVLHARRCDG